MLVDGLFARLLTAEERTVAGKKQQFVGLTAALDAMSPLKVLTRGYAIATDSRGRLLRSVAQVKAGDSIELRLSDGGLQAVVKNIHPSEEKQEEIKHE